MMLSIALEAPVAVVVVATADRIRARGRLTPLESLKRLGLVALAAAIGTGITHPIVWDLNDALAGLSTWSRLTILECGAALIEAATYFFVARLTWSLALVVSALANGFSFGVGLVIFWLQGQ